MGHETVFIKDSRTLEAANVRNGGLDVNLQDQTSRLFGNHFSRRLDGALPMYADWLQDTYILQLVAGHGVSPGDNLFVYNGLGAMELYVVTVTPIGAYDDLRVDTLASQDFLMAGDNPTEVYHVSFDLNVNGSVTPVSFRFPAEVSLQPPISLDVTNVNFNIQTGSATLPDDGQFGGITALTRGLIGRHHRSDGINHLATFRINGAMATFGTVEYTNSAPAGTTGVRANFTFGGQENAGVVLRVEPDDYIELIVQDDLSAMAFFHAVAIGHVVVP